MKQGLTLVELAFELDRQRAARVDYLVPGPSISCVTEEESIISLDGCRTPDGEPVAGLRVNDVAHIQVADRLDIPKRYYDMLRTQVPDLFDTTVNRLLRHHAKATAPNWMIRTMDGTARAALSDRYKRVDNDAVAEVVMNVLMEVPDVTVRTTYVDDRFMYIKATSPELSGRVLGEEVVGGLCVRNSEVGFAKTAIYPFVEERRCENGLIIPRRDEATLEEPHRGSLVSADEYGRVIDAEEIVDRKFELRVKEVVKAAIDRIRFAELVEDMERAAASERLGNAPAAVQVLVKREGLTDQEGEGVLQQLAERGDFSRWGLVSAITSTAEKAETFRRATELETLGGRVLDYPGAEWSSLVAAA